MDVEFGKKRAVVTTDAGGATAAEMEEALAKAGFEGSREEKPSGAGVP